MAERERDDAAMLRALGVNPDQVRAGTLQIIYDNEGQPFVSYTVVARVGQAQLGKAMLMSVAQATEDAEEADVSRETSRPRLIRGEEGPQAPTPEGTPFEMSEEQKQRQAVKRTHQRHDPEPEDRSEHFEDDH